MVAVEAALMGTSWCANFTTYGVLRIGRRYHLGVAEEHQLVVAVNAAVIAHLKIGNHSAESCKNLLRHGIHLTWE